MHVAVISIGTELTRGELIDTNTAWLADALTGLGFDAPWQLTCDDDSARIVQLLKHISTYVKIIVCTGGLGPTTDDLTTAAVAEALCVDLVRDQASLDAIAARFAKIGRVMTPNNHKQADFPSGAEVLPNPIGSAPGFSVTIGVAQAFFMPGVPQEMKLMFNQEVVPRIAARAPRNQAQVRLRTYGRGESHIGEMLNGVEHDFAVTIGYRAHFPEVEVKVLAEGRDLAEARARSEAAAKEVEKRLGDVVYTRGTQSFAEVAAEALRQKNLTLAAAESCTGGLLSHLLTRTPASDYFYGSVVTYADDAKRQFLQVSEHLLAEHGAVSPEVARAMALGVRERSGAHVALAMTGIAGPTGGSEKKPVGLVYIAMATAAGVEVKEHRFSGDRERVQMLTAYEALRMARDFALNA